MLPRLIGFTWVGKPADSMADDVLLQLWYPMLDTLTQDRDSLRFIVLHEGIIFDFTFDERLMCILIQFQFLLLSKVHFLFLSF